MSEEKSSDESKNEPKENQRSNRERLLEAGVLKPGLALSPEQAEAIDGLSEEEVQQLIYAKNKLEGAIQDFLLEVPSRITSKAGNF